MKASEIFGDGLDAVKNFIEDEAKRVRFEAGDAVWFQDAIREKVTIGGMVYEKMVHAPRRAIVLGYSLFFLDSKEEPVYEPRLTVALDTWHTDPQTTIISWPERIFYATEEECQEASDAQNLIEDERFLKQLEGVLMHGFSGLALKIGLGGKASLPDGSPDLEELSRLLGEAAKDVLTGAPGKSIYSKDGVLIGRWDLTCLG